MSRHRSRRAPGPSCLVGLFALSAVLLVAPRFRAARSDELPVPIVDLHVDLSYQTNYQGQRFALGTGQYPAADLSPAGVAGVVLPLFVPASVSPSGPRATDLERSYARVLGELGVLDDYRLPGCTPGAGGVRTWLALEGAAPLADDPGAAFRWVARGVRLFGLVHSEDNRLATSATGKSHGRTGLSAEGRRLVAEIHRAGGIVDVSHASSRTLWEVVELARTARRAVVASHSNARALADHPRNLTDDEIRAIASTGGMVGINLHSAFLARGRPATLGDVVRHIRHVIDVGGIEHVGIGSDFEGGIRPPAELRAVSNLPKLASALETAGQSRADVRRIMAGNALRLLCP